MQYIYSSNIESRDYTSLSEAYMHRLINRSDIFSTQWIAKDGDLVYLPNYFKNDNPPRLTVHQIKRHFEFEQTIAISATDENECSKWGCWDLDTNDDRLLNIEQFLKDCELSTLRTEPSCSEKGGHLFLSLVQPVPAVVLHFFHQAVIDELGLSTKDLEFYPKWNTKKEAAPYSQIRAPLGKHKKATANGAVEYFIGPDPKLLEQLTWLNEQPYNPVEGIIEIAQSKKRLFEEEKEKLAEAIKLSYLRNGKKIDFSPVNLLNVIPGHDLHWRGGEYSAPCNLCRSIGLDKSGDNLRISPDGMKVNCVTNGINVMHGTRDIYNFYLS